MKLRPGYKQTEVGVIPDDWVVCDLKESCTKITDGTHDTPKPVNSGIPFLTAIHVKDNRIDYKDCLYVTKEEHEIIFKRCNPEKGDVLMVNIGAGVATTALVNVDYEFSLKNVALLKPSLGRLFGSYLNYCLALKKPEITQTLLNGGAQPFLSLAQIGQIKIPLPKPEEQRAIADVLSDVDALIASLDKLIAKKRDIKQGVTQQLLTGKNRLPGFSGEWEVKRLGDLLEYEQPTKYLVKDCEYNDGNEVPVLTAGKTFILGYTNEENGIFNNLPVIIFDDFTTANKYVTFPFKAKSSAMKILKPRNATVNLRLVFEVMQLIKFQLGDHKRYWISEYQKLEVKIPLAEEQTAIATVLSDMDAEIAAIEARRYKTQAIKQGMMQALLTGKIRMKSSVVMQQNKGKPC